jgi:mono/diheme cytochrome c family protein
MTRSRRSSNLFLLVALALLCALGSGCTQSSVVDMRVTAPEAVAQAEQIFAARCAKCHGPKGKGDGPEAARLNPRPRNFSDPTWHLAVSDRHIDQIIVEGGAAVGKSAVMPPNSDLAAKRDVVVALRQHLRELAGSQ